MSGVVFVDNSFPITFIFFKFSGTDLLILGYRAVICGMDPVCCESSSWIKTAQVEKLTRGPDQPFYQV